MPIPRTMSPKMRKMIDLKIKCKKYKKDFYSNWPPGPRELRAHT